MIVIPTAEIKKPDLHADTIGYTFVWNGHFLRGIFPTSVDCVKGYFESGLIDEIVSKELFPQTWISEFENEQFGMIIEHEMISPIICAMEWNYTMLKDAALMVLEVAQIAWKYGYNMEDCHKRNVLFKNNKPYYVDLGSFIPQGTGETGWKPYVSFLQSYYYILDVWKDGANQIAKRVMAPGVQFDEMDYFLYKRRFYRWFPMLANARIQLRKLITHFLSFSFERLDSFLPTNTNPIIKKTIRCAKKIMNRVKLMPCQNLNRIYKKIKHIHFSQQKVDIVEEMSDGEDIVEILNEYCSFCSTITFVDCHHPELYHTILEQANNIKSIIAISQEDYYSNTEYVFYRGRRDNVCCVQFKILNNSILMMEYPYELRFSSDLVILSDLKVEQGMFGLHNTLVFINRCRQFSKMSSILVNVRGFSLEQREVLLNDSFIDVKKDWYLYKGNDD